MKNQKKHLQQLLAEVRNFQNIAAHLVPSAGEIPRLPGIDIYGESMPLSGLIGGDHIVYVDFNKRYDLAARIRDAEAAGRLDIAANLAANRSQTGILLADVSGHRITDASLTAMLHQAFLVGVTYELELYGKITTKLFETINTRFYQSSAIGKYLTMIYGEISETGTFRFISAGHLPPVVFSREYGRFMEINPDRLISFPPIGTMLSETDVDRKGHRSPLGYKEDYTINEINLMNWGDILILYTDGLSDHRDAGDRRYFPERLEDKLRNIRDLPARDIYFQIREDLLQFADPTDDLTYLIIKKT